MYCLIPCGLAGKLHEPLRRLFREDAGVEVVVERRGRDRRGGAERRVAEEERPGTEERRRVHAAQGRRSAERRAALVPVDAPRPLPRRLRPYADRLVFAERLEPSTQEAEDAETARLVARFQSGDSDAFATIYTRYFDRVYRYFRMMLRDAQGAEDATQQVFMQAFEALPRYARRSQPFRAWLFIIVRNCAVGLLRRQHQLVLDPVEMARREEGARADDAGMRPLEWMSGSDFLLLIERLPLPQRQVLVLRYMLDMSSREIGTVLGKDPGAVRALHHRALRTLETRLRALGRAPVRGRRDERMRRWPKRAPVLRGRRFALMR